MLIISCRQFQHMSKTVESIVFNRHPLACQGDGDCPPGVTTHCVLNICVECKTEEHCPQNIGKDHCHPEENTCVQCTKDTVQLDCIDKELGRACNVLTSTCTCFINKDCEGNIWKREKCVGKVLYYTIAHGS